MLSWDLYDPCNRIPRVRLLYSGVCKIIYPTVLVWRPGDKENAIILFILLRVITSCHRHTIIIMVRCLSLEPKSLAVRDRRPKLVLQNLPASISVQPERVETGASDRIPL